MGLEHSARAPGTGLPTSDTGRRRLRVVRQVARDPLALSGLLILAALGITAVAAPALAPHDPVAVDAASILEPPSNAHPLGTDTAGRDILSRLIFGARWSLGIAAIAALVVMMLGLAIGALAGYYGGTLDQLLMRLVDVLLAFPNLILALVIIGVLGPGIQNVMIGLVTVWWLEYGRIVRGMVLSLRESGYVEGARALGASNIRIIVRHILPGVTPPVAVLVTLEMGSLILALTGLSFLGLGIQPPTPEWGAMINEARRHVTTEPQLMIYPGIAITVAVMGFNFLGDGIRDALDPHLPQRVRQPKGTS